MDLRSVDVSHATPVAPAEQAAPQLAWVDIASMRIDDAFQRPLGANNWKAIRKIAADFRWSRFSPALVAPIPGGLFSVLDGQHRIHAAAICGFTSVPAMIVLVPPAEQASAFIHVNASAIRVSPHQVYRAALGAGEEWALQSKAAVEAAGCRLPTRNNVLTKDKKPGDVFALTLVTAMVGAGKAGSVTAALTAMKLHDTTGRTALWSDYVLKPWIEAVAERPGATQEALIAALDRRDPFLVIEAANRAAEEQRVPASVKRRAAFITLIDANLRVAA